MLNFSLGSAFPGFSPEKAMEVATNIKKVPVLGAIGVSHAQICPQNYQGGPITLERIKALQEAYPETQFRFHANVRILEKGCQYDLGTADRLPEYTEELGHFLAELGQPYSLHAAGNMRPLNSQIRLAQNLTIKFGVPVAIEGLYPSRVGNTLSVWDDWKTVLDRDVYFALDFSHLNIILKQLNTPVPVKLIEDLLASPNCLEVHLSGNDGLRDSHEACGGEEWWLDFLPLIKETSVCFYEGKSI